METIKIMGKDYATVNARLKAFREEHKDWSLISDLLQMTNESCVIKATILDETGRVLATGIAQEDRTSSTINKTSYVENCETSAWGRALGNLGYGIDVAVASADEVAMAVAKQGIKEQIVGGDYIMPCGKHKGMQIKELPTDYIEWYLENGYDETIKKNMRQYNAEKYASKQPEQVEVGQNSGSSFMG